MNNQKLINALDLLKFLYLNEINKKREVLKKVLTPELYESELKNLVFLEEGITSFCEKIIKISNGENILVSLKEETIFKKAYSYSESYLSNLERKVVPENPVDHQKNTQFFNRQIKNKKNDMELIMDVYKSQKLKC